MRPLTPETIDAFLQLGDAEYRGPLPPSYRADESSFGTTENSAAIGRQLPKRIIGALERSDLLIFRGGADGIWSLTQEGRNFYCSLKKIEAALYL